MIIKDLNTVFKAFCDQRKVLVSPKKGRPYALIMDEEWKYANPKNITIKDVMDNFDSFYFKFSDDEVFNNGFVYSRPIDSERCLKEGQEVYIANITAVATFTYTKDDPRSMNVIKNSIPLGIVFENKQDAINCCHAARKTLRLSLLQANNPT